MEKRLLSADEVTLLAQASELYQKIYARSCPFFLVFQFSAGTQELVRATYPLPQSADSIFWSLAPSSPVIGVVSPLLRSLCHLQEKSSGKATLRADPVVLICEELKVWLALSYASFLGASPTERRLRMDYLAGLRLLLAEEVPSLDLPALDACIAAVETRLENDFQDEAVHTQDEHSSTAMRSLLSTMRSLGCCGLLFLFYVFRARKFAHKVVPADFIESKENPELKKAMESRSGQWLRILVESHPFQNLLASEPKLNSIFESNPFLRDISNAPRDRVIEMKSSHAVDGGQENSSLSMWVAPGTVVKDLTEISDILPFFRRSAELMDHFIGMHGWLFELARTFSVMSRMFRYGASLEHRTTKRVCHSLHSLLVGLEQTFERCRSKAQFFDQAIDGTSRNKASTVSLWSLLASRIQKDVASCQSLLTQQFELSNLSLPPTIAAQAETLCALLDRLADMNRAPEVVGRNRARELDHAAAQANRYAEQAQRHMVGGNPGEAVHCFSLAIELNPSAPELAIYRAEATDLQAYSTGAYDRPYREIRRHHQDLTDERKLEELSNHISADPFCWTVRVVELTHVGLTSMGAFHLVDGLVRCSNLTEVSLAHNSMDDEGVIALVQLLVPTTQPLPKLECLNLACNLITNRGAIALAGALSSNSFLAHLDISGNAIEELGIEALAEAVLTNDNSELQTLNLARNKLTQEGIGALTRMVREKDLFVDVSLGAMGDVLKITNECRDVWIEFERIVSDRRRQGRRPSITHGPNTDLGVASIEKLRKLIGESRIAEESELQSTEGNTSDMKLISLSDSNAWPLLEPCARRSRTDSLADHTNSLIESQIEVLDNYQTIRTRYFQSLERGTHTLNDATSIIINEHRDWLLRLWQLDTVMFDPTSLSDWLAPKNDHLIIKSFTFRVLYFRSLLKESSKLLLSPSFCHVINQLTLQLEGNKLQLEADRQLSQIEFGRRKLSYLCRYILHQAFIFLIYCHIALIESQATFSRDLTLKLSNLLSSLPFTPCAQIPKILSDLCSILQSLTQDSCLSLRHVEILSNSSFARAFASMFAPPTQGEPSSLSSSLTPNSSPTSRATVSELTAIVSLDSVMLDVATFNYGSTQVQKRQILPPKVLNTCGPLFASGELVMAYFKNKDDPFAATIVKCNNNGTYHVRFDDGETDFRCPEQRIMTREWQPKVRSQPDALVWMEPVLTKSKTKSHVFSMYKPVEVDEFSGFVLQKRKKSAGEAHRALVRIVSSSSYPFWEVAYSDSLEEAQSKHWKYITEIKSVLPPNLSKVERQDWIINHIHSLINPPATLDAQTSKQAMSWLSRSKASKVDVGLTERLLEAINVEQDHLEKSDVNLFLEEWCSLHGVINIEDAIGDFWDKFTCEPDGRIERKRLLSFLTAVAPVGVKLPPPPPNRLSPSPEVVTEVKLNLEPYFERFHGLVGCLEQLFFASCADVASSEWSHLSMTQSLGTVLQWTSLTCQLVLNCIQDHQTAFDRYDKTMILTNTVSTSNYRPPPDLIKSLKSNLSQAMKFFHKVRDSVVDFGARDKLSASGEPISSRATIWQAVTVEAIKATSDFIPSHLSTSLHSSSDPSCTFSLRLHVPDLIPLVISKPPVVVLEDMDCNSLLLQAPIPPMHPVSPPPPPSVTRSAAAPPPPPPEIKQPGSLAASGSTAISTTSIRRVVTVALPKGLPSSQTKVQISYTDTAGALKARVLSKFGSSVAPVTSYVLSSQGVDLADGEELGQRNNYVLKVARETGRDNAQAAIEVDRIFEAAQYVTQAEAALRAGNEAAAMEFFELQRLCLAAAEKPTPKSRAEELTVVHRELKSQEQLALQYKRDAERYMKAGLSQSAVSNYELQITALQRVEELRTKLRALKGELEVTIYSGQAPTARAVLDSLQVHQRASGQKVANAALVFNLELGFLALAASESKTLLEGLGSQVGIRRISLHASNTDDSGLFALASLWTQMKSLPQLPNSLIYLDLNSNAIGPAGSEALGEILATNQVLEYLDVSCNPLGTSGCLPLVRALEDNPLSGLKILRMAATGADDSTAKATVRGLSFNTSLMEIWLHGNEVSNSLLDRIAAKLQRPRSSQAREANAAQWRVFRDEYLDMSLSSFIGSVTVHLNDFLDYNVKDKTPLRLLVAFCLLPIKLKQTAQILKPKIGSGRFVDHTVASIQGHYHGILSAFSFLMKVARLLFRQQERLRASRQPTEDPLTSLFDRFPLQQVQDWFEALVLTTTTLMDRIWWHLEEALSFADRNPNLIKLSLSLLSITLANFVKNEDNKAHHEVANAFLPAMRLPPDMDQYLRDFKAAQKEILDLLFAPEESVGLRSAIEDRIKASIAKRVAALTSVQDADNVGISDWLTAKPQRDDSSKVIAGLRELVDDLGVVHDSLRPCFGSYDIQTLYLSEYLRLIKVTLQTIFPPKGLDAGTAVALLEFLQWAHSEIEDSLEQDMAVWDFFLPEVNAYYSAYESQSQAKVLSWLDNVIQLDFKSDENKQCVVDDDCVFTNTPTDAFNTLDRYINSFLDLLPARCFTEARIEAVVAGLTKAIGHVHTRLKNALELGIEYSKGGKLENTVVVWINGEHRKTYRYVVAQVNNLVRFESHIDDLKEALSKKLQGIAGVAFQEKLLNQIDDCSELFGDVAAAGVDVLAHALQLRVSACLQHQFTPKWLVQVTDEAAEEDTELLELLTEHISTIGCGFARKAFLGELLKQVFRSTVMDYFESFLLSGLPLGDKAQVVFDVMRVQLCGFGLLFEDYSDLLSAKILQQDIRYDSSLDCKHAEGEVLAIAQALVTCELDFLPAHFDTLHAKFSQPRFIERGLPPIVCVHALLAMRPDLNFHERCEHLHAFELKHPSDPASMRSIKDAELLSFLSADSATRNKQVKQKLVGAKRDVGLQLERAKGLAKSKLKEANAVAKERVQKFKDKRHANESESAAWGAAKEEGAKKLAQAKEKLKLWRRK